RLEVDAAAVAGTLGFGYEVAAHLHASGGWSVSGGVGARFGDIDAARVNATTVRVSAGLGIDVVRSSRFVAGLAVDGLALRSDLHRQVGGRFEEHARWVGGFDLLGTGAFALTDAVAIFLSTGLEFAFGQTVVVVGDAPLATVPRLRGVVLAGVRLRF
ncbi:MAG: hypothetical protein ACXVEF_31100, partial [Polyangiales bacterium]